MRKLVMFLSALMMAPLLIAGATQANASTINTDPQDVIYHQLFQQGNSLHCVYTGNQNQDNPVSYVSCVNPPLNAAWQWVPTVGNFYEIVNHNGKCLADPGGGSDGTALTTETCNHTDLQYWLPNPYDNGWPVTWLNQRSGRCMDGGNDQIRVWSCNNSIVQEWVGP